MKRNIFEYGVIATFIWILLFVLFIGDRADQLLDMSLNELGDFCAGMFAPIAFGWLVLGYIQQGKELRINSNELRNSVEALNLQADELRSSVEQQRIMAEISKSQYEEIIEQRNDQRRSRDEETFFRMLETFNTAVSQIDIGPQQQLVGKDAIMGMVQSIEYILKSERDAKDNNSFKSGVVNKYEEWYLSNTHDLSHYFRLMYNIVKFVHNSSVSDKKKITNILRASLSDDEATLLMINGLSTHGERRFKPLIERYSLIKHYNNQLSNIDRLVEFYDPQAFAGSD